MQSTKTLADLVNKRLRCLLQLGDLGEKQTECIATGDMPGLMRLLAAKSQLITALQAIESRLAPFHAEDPESRTWESPAARAACAAEAEQCRLLLARVMAMEARNEAQLTDERDSLGQQLQVAHAANRARNAYAAAGAGVHRPHDRVSPPASSGSLAPRAAGGLDVASQV